GTPRGRGRAARRLAGRLWVLSMDCLRRGPHAGPVQGLQQARADGADPQTGTSAQRPAIEHLGQQPLRRSHVEAIGRAPEGAPLWILQLPARRDHGEHRAEPRGEPIDLRGAPAEGGEPDHGQPDPVPPTVLVRRKEAGQDAAQRDAGRTERRGLRLTDPARPEVSAAKQEEPAWLPAALRWWLAPPVSPVAGAGRDGSGRWPSPARPLPCRVVAGHHAW